MRMFSVIRRRIIVKNERYRTITSGKRKSGESLASRVLCLSGNRFCFYHNFPKKRYAAHAAVASALALADYSACDFSIKPYNGIVASEREFL
ncbi:hypothetical protein AU490_10755 [Lonsdalea populi]|nr:hypothetical protein AU490_10755 [Lonsdalea populi]ROH81033.1 hypothetical protein EC394_08650 [Lonsdalea populi]